MLARTLQSDRFFFFCTKTRRKDGTEEFYCGKKGLLVSQFSLTGFGKTQLPNAAHRTLAADVGPEVWLPGSTGRVGGHRRVRRKRDGWKVRPTDLRFGKISFLFEQIQ